MMKCIEIAVAAGHLSREEGAALQREIDSLLRTGLATPEVKARLMADMEAQGREAKRRALLTEAKRAGLEDILLTHKNARGENDPGQAIIYLLEHHGQARFADVEHRRIAILAGVQSDIENFLHEFRKGALKGDKRRMSEEMQAKLDDVVRELMGEKTKSKPAAEMAQALGRVIEDLRQRFNEAGGHVAKLDHYVPQHHDADALLKAGQKAWVDYHMQPGVLARHKMQTLAGKPMTNEQLREALGVAWERITTDGWIDREPSQIPYGKGPLYNRYSDHRFIHYKNADAWLDYQRNFSGGDPYTAVLGYIAKMSRDIAFMEIMGPNPEAMKNWLLQWVAKQAAIEKPNAVILKEQTAWFKEFVEKATGGSRYEGLVKDVGRIVGDMAELRRQLSTREGGRDLEIENRLWNRAKELDDIQAKIADMDVGTDVKRRDEIQQRLEMIDREAELLRGKASSPSRRNRKKLADLKTERNALNEEFGQLAMNPLSLERADPQLAKRLQQFVDAMKGELEAGAHASDHLVGETLDAFVRWRQSRADMSIMEDAHQRELTQINDEITATGSDFQRNKNFRLSDFVLPGDLAKRKVAAARHEELILKRDIIVRRHAIERKVKKQRLDEHLSQIGPMVDRINALVEPLRTALPEGSRSTKAQLDAVLAVAEKIKENRIEKSAGEAATNQALSDIDAKLAKLGPVNPDRVNEVAGTPGSLPSSVRAYDAAIKHRELTRERERIVAAGEEAARVADINYADLGEQHLRMMSESDTQLGALMRERESGFRAVDDPKSATRIQTFRFEQMWAVMRGNAEAPVGARLANTMQTGRNVMSAALLGQAVLSSLTDVVFQRVSRQFAGMNGSMWQVMGGMLQQFSQGNRREAVRAGLIMDSALHVMQQQARYVEGIDTRSLSGYVADRVISLSGLSAWTQAGKHAFGMAMQAEFGARVDLAFPALPDLLRKTLERHGIGSEMWDTMRTAALHNPTDGLEMLRPNEIAKLGVAGRDAAEAYLSMIHRETKFAVPEGTVGTTALMKVGKPGTFAGELSRNFGQFKSFGAAVMMLHGGRIAAEHQAGRTGKAVSMAASLLFTGAIAGGIVVGLKDIVNGKKPRGIRDLMEGKAPHAAFWMEALLTAGGLGILGDFMFSGVNRLGGGLSSFIVGPFGGQIDRMRDRTFGNLDEFAKGENMKLGREAVATVRDLMPGGTLWYLRLAKERLLMNKLEAMVDSDAAQKSWRAIEQRTRKKQHTEYWWRPGETMPRDWPLQVGR